MKKIILYICSLVVIISLICSVGVGAEELTPIVSVSTHTATPGDTIVVSVSISENPGIQAMSFTLSYDKDIFTYVSVEKGGLSDYMFANHQDKGYFSFVNCELSNKVYNGIIFSATFTVSNDAPFGDFPFKIQNIDPKNADDLTGCFANSQHSTIIPVVNNGKVTVNKTCKNAGHDMGEWKISVNPSCEGKGAREKICKRCGHTETSQIEATGHSFADQWTIDTPATPTQQGIMSRHCKNCTAIKDKTNFTLENSQENNFENEENNVLPPESWDVLEEIIDAENNENQQHSSEKSENSNKKESPSFLDKLPLKQIAFGVFCGVILITATLIILKISKRR